MPLALPLKALSGACLTACWPLLALAQSTPATSAPAQPAEDAELAFPEAPSELDAELFYQLLMGELKLRDSDPGAAFSLYHDAARRTQDEDLYRRAVEIALQGRAGNAALNAARDWAQAHPSHDEPHRYSLQILLALNRATEVAPSLTALLELTPAERRQDVIAAVPQTLSRLSDKAAAQAAAAAALRPWLDRPETAAVAWTAMGRLHMAQDRDAEALAAAERGLAMDPTATAPVQLALQLMERPAGLGEPLVRYALRQTQRTDTSALHLLYVRVLVDLRRTDDAERELSALIQHAPALPEPWLLRGALHMQAKRLDDAQTALERYLALSRAQPGNTTKAGQNQAFLLLSQVAEARRDFAGANAWLDRIEDGDALLSAQVRRATLLARQNRLDDGLSVLQQLPERNAEETRRKWLAEAQLLRDFDRHDAAQAVYAKMVERFPDDPDIAYEQAMAADRAGRFDLMERLLRQLMVRHPDYHHAYNALGYALTERNERLPEARGLIQKALQAAPNDAYILDSLGWVEFRMGHADAALQALQEAYRRQPDPEIAAHLGEVLWQLGRRDDALGIWREGLLLNPEHAGLRETLRRLGARP